MTRARERDVAGAALLHPLPIACIALLIVNDHWLKGAAPGWLSGKLSDVAGLGFFPLLLQALIELSGVDRYGRVTPARVLIVCCAASGVAFCALQLWAPAAAAYELGLGALRYPLDAAAAFVSGQPWPARGRVAVTPDPSDLWALPALAAPFLASHRRRQVPGFLPGGAPAG